jgi:DNA end-binding protein Ku
MAGSLIETLSGEFDASQYKDSYREALESVIEAKVQGREVVQPTEQQPTSGTVVDLMAALRASVEAAKSGKPAAAGGGDEDAERSESPPAAKRTAKRPAARATEAPAEKPASKSPARAAAKPAVKAKAPAKKAPAKKAPAKRKSA